MLRYLITAAQHRKVNLFGDPEWHTSPKADFIASLVFGGPLEHIQCMVNSAAVTFINAADAQAFYENTANGIVYRADADCVHYAEARMAIDPTPTSSYVQDLVNQGATRSVRAIGVDPVTSLNSIRHLAEGKIRSQGVPSRKLESLEDTMNANGVSTILPYVHFPLIKRSFESLLSTIVTSVMPLRSRAN